MKKSEKGKKGGKRNRKRKKKIGFGKSNLFYINLSPEILLRATLSITTRGVWWLKNSEMK